MVVSAVLAAAVAGCGDNGAPLDEQGQIELQVISGPAAVTDIHVVVTGPGIMSDVSGDLVENGGTWSGTVVNVPAGPGRTVTASGYDGVGQKIYEGVTENVTVVSGMLTRIAVHLLPFPNDSGGTGLDTPPHFGGLVHPAAIETDAFAALAATALDPDVGNLLTYTWSATPPGGTFDDGDVDGDAQGNIIINRVSEEQVDVLYTPPLGYTGNVIIQVNVSDGEASATTTFPLAVGAGLEPGIQFDVLPELTITGADRQVLMPGDSIEIGYTLTNPGDEWSAESMHVHTAWSDTCGGGFFTTDDEAVDVVKDAPVSRSVTYTTTGEVPEGFASCMLKLTVSDDLGAKLWSAVFVWIEEPLTVFVSSGTVDGASFGGSAELADAFCQTAAGAGFLPAGLYKALVSFDEISAMDRIADGPYILFGGLVNGDPIAGAPVARSKADLFGGGETSLLHAIDVDEFGATVLAGVFTGTSSSGETTTFRCDDWTSNDPGHSATGGSTTVGDAGWVASGVISCDTQARVYCFQQTHVRN